MLRHLAGLDGRLATASLDRLAVARSLHRGNVWQCRRQLLRAFCTAPSISPPPPLDTEGMMDISHFTPDRIRNFCIIAHIDHGKTSLSTRLMELTGTISSNEKNSLFLDKLQVEKERGITVKAQTCSMFHSFPGKDGKEEQLLLNLIDTPGHVDFSYEVSRSLMACESAILLVDGTQGTQAQTVSNLFLALDADLEIVPVVNKCDVENMREVIEGTKEDLRGLLMLEGGEDGIRSISAKTGMGIPSLLASLAELPAPKSRYTNESGKETSARDAPFRSIMFDNWYDSFRGIICLMRVLEGEVKKGDTVTSAVTNQHYDVAEVGIMHPAQQPTTSLSSGQVGYMILGMKDTKEAKVGDTFFHKGVPVDLLPGFKDVQPMVFAGIYPLDSEQYDEMKDAVQRLVLNDAGVTVHPEMSAALGSGYRCGFLGLLHMEVFMQRMEQEFNIPVLATAPSVPYKVTLNDGTEKVIENPADFPESTADYQKCMEPTVRATIIAPSEYLGGLIRLCQDREGEQLSVDYIDKTRMKLVYRLPLGEIVIDFYDRLKQLSSGYASFDYEDAGYQKANRVKIGVRLDGENIEPLATVCTVATAEKHARSIVHKLKEQIPKQMHEVAIQATLGSKILARATVKALRKDVTAKCYGGDVSRKRKLLEKQKEGKKRMKQLGRVQVTKDTFINILRRD